LASRTSSGSADSRPASGVFHWETRKTCSLVSIESATSARRTEVFILSSTLQVTAARCAPASLEDGRIVVIFRALYGRAHQIPCGDTSLRCSTWSNYRTCGSHWHGRYGRYGRVPSGVYGSTYVETSASLSVIALQEVLQSSRCDTGTPVVLSTGV
jgi:hypothetical protein